MQRLSQKCILLGISGGIAAYKSAELTRLLKREGADVRVVMTPAACEFISPLTFQALSGNPVHLQLLDTEAEAGMGHIELAKWADHILIAPASADLIARLANGFANDLLSTLCLASEAPLAVAPAMNQAMWKHPASQENINTLQNRGVDIFGPGSGEQACGDVGFGRMLEPTELVELLCNRFQPQILTGKKVVITAGPTREAIDPVRYISNHSSGKMGYALATAAASAGAQVTLISGPVNLAAPSMVDRVSVSSAREMLDASLETIEDCDIFIAAAAVADYRTAQIAEQKMKKGSEDQLTLALVKNPDIVATVANHPNRPFTVGFAAETENLLDYARSKLERKNLDLIIANDVSRTDIGFNSDNNAVTLVSHNQQIELPLCSKDQLAHQLISHIAKLYLKNDD